MKLEAEPSSEPPPLLVLIDMAMTRTCSGPHWSPPRHLCWLLQLVVQRSLNPSARSPSLRSDGAPQGHFLLWVIFLFFCISGIKLTGRFSSDWFLGGRTKMPHWSFSNCSLAVSHAFRGFLFSWYHELERSIFRNMLHVRSTVGRNCFYWVWELLLLLSWSERFPVSCSQSVYSEAQTCFRSWSPSIKGTQQNVVRRLD